MKKLQLALLFMGLTLGGCLKAAMSGTGPLATVPIPSELASRTVFKTVGPYQNHLDQLVGHVLSGKRDAGGNCPTSYADIDVSIRSFAKPGVTLEPDNNAQLRYQAKISGGGTASASYLAISATLGGNQKAEVIMTDTSSMIVKDGDIDIAALGAVPMPPDVCERYLIKGAVLTAMVYKVFSEFNTTIQAGGSAFGADGKAYYESSGFALDFKLGLVLAKVGQGGNMGMLAATPGAGGPFDKVVIPAAGFNKRAD